MPERIVDQCLKLIYFLSKMFNLNWSHWFQILAIENDKISICSLWRSSENCDENGIHLTGKYSFIRMNGALNERERHEIKKKCKYCWDESTREIYILFFVFSFFPIHSWRYWLKSVIIKFIMGRCGTLLLFDYCLK